MFSNPVWSGSNTVPPTIIRNLTALSSQIAYESIYDTNLTTLSINDAATTDGILQGLLYVPDLGTSHPCSQTQYEDPVYLPKNVTKKSNLPPANYKLIAIAPWYNDSCTTAYLDAVRYDPIQGFVFYRPVDDVYDPLHSQDTTYWTIDGGNRNWPKKYRFPIYAVPRDSGRAMIEALSEYSGTIETVPYGANITTLFGPNSQDYVRIWTQMRVTDNHHSPALWMFFVIVIASLITVISGVSLFMHLIQRGRRKQLERRVQGGEVDLEKMGIARVRVPMSHIKEDFPLFTYCYDPETMTPPASPVSANTPAHQIRRLSRPDRAISEIVSGGSNGAATATGNGSLVGSDYTAVGTNYQPRCEVCMVAFENRVSVIRQLPCFHIFHAECIEEFLSHVSSLCPLCRQSMLPKGHCPEITNAMVYRERRIHRLRGHIMLDDDESKNSRVMFVGRAWKHFTTRVSDSIPRFPATGRFKGHGDSIKLPQLATISSASSNDGRHRDGAAGHEDDDDEDDAPRPMSSKDSTTPEDVSIENVASQGLNAPATDESRNKEDGDNNTTTTTTNTAIAAHTNDTAHANNNGGHAPTATATATAGDTTTTPPPPTALPLAPTTQPKSTYYLRRKPRAVVLPPVTAPQMPMQADTVAAAAAAAGAHSEGRKSPGTIRRQRVRQYAMALDEQESRVEQNRPYWRRVATKMFPTLG